MTPAGWENASGRCHTENRLFKSLAFSGIHADGAGVIPACAFPRSLVDLQATDQVILDSKAPSQLSGPPGEVAGEASSHDVALLI